jgi:hypothetical protein
MRLVFPIVIVSVATGLGWGDVTNMALNSPAEYAKHLTAAHVQIAMFGGSFLFLVFLYFMFDAEKEVHWIPAIERRTQKLGRMDGAPILMALIAVLAVQAILPEAERLTALEAGVAGIVLYMLVGSIDLLFEQEQPAHDAHASHGQTAGSTVVKQVTRSGFAAFLYLEVLDASFSFDGVIGAFAITQDVVIIMVGLAIGAMFVRSMTVYLVHKGTLQQYIYLEHGAHYAIGILALIMFASTVIHIPEVITGLIGVGFIIASVRSSVRSGQNPA